MATVTQVEEEHDVAASTWECGEPDCGEQFPYVGAPNYCPECGAEFTTVNRLADGS